jgi:hypothetical protein
MRWWWVLACLIGSATTLSGHPIYDGHIHGKNIVLLIIIFTITYILFWKSDAIEK